MPEFFQRDINFFSIPSFSECLATAFLCFAFLMPMCGTLPLLGILGFFQVCFTLLILIIYKQNVRVLLHGCRISSPFIFLLFIAWLLLTLVSYVLIMFETSLVWQILAATGRQSYILLQSFYVIAVAVFLKAMKVSLMQVLLLLSLGLLCMFAFMLWLYQVEAYHDSWIWFFNPLLIVHIRDLGNVAVVSGLALSVQYIFGVHSSYLKQTFCLLALSVVFTFILWAGGRMAVFAFIFTLILLLVMAKYFSSMTFKSILSLFLTLVLSFFLLEIVSVFEWNGIARSSSVVTDFKGVKSADAVLLNKLSTGRLEMWSMSLNAVAESPFFGLGPYGYYFIPERSYGDQPHNLIVQFIVEWGGVGTLVVLILLVSLAVKAVKVLPQAFRIMDKDYIVAVSIVFALTIHALTGGTYFNVQPMYCLTLGFSGLCFHSCMAKPSVNKKVL